MNRGYEVLALRHSTAVFKKNYKRLSDAEKKYSELLNDEKLFVSLTDETDIKVIKKGIFSFVSGNKNIKYRNGKVG
jgi:hypothetical protein